MQKWLILWLGVLLSSSLSAAAQTPATQVALIPAPAAPLLVLIRVVPAQLPQASVPPEQLAGKTLVGLVLAARAESPDQALKRLFSVEVVRTMFVTESRMPIIELPGGRLQLDGFTSTYHLRNVLIGPSGLDQPGVNVPRSAWVYGISLRFRLGAMRRGTPHRWMAALSVDGGRRSRKDPTNTTDHGGQR